MIKNKILRFKSKCRKLLKCSTGGEFIRQLPFGYIEKMALLPGAMLLIAYIRHFLFSFFDTEALQFIPAYKSQYYSQAAVFAYICSALVIVLYLAKLRTVKGSIINCIKNYFKSSFPMVLLTVYFLFILLSPFINGFTTDAMKGVGNRFEPYYYLLSYYFCFIMPVTVVRKEKSIRLIVYSLIFLSIATAFMTLLKPSLADGPFVYYNSGFFHNTNHYGYFLTMSIGLCAAMAVLEKNTKLRTAAIAGLVLNAAEQVLNNSFGSILSSIAALMLLMIMLWIAKGKFVPASLAVFGLFMGVSLAAAFFFRPAYFLNFSFLSRDIKKILNETEDAGSAGSGRIRLWRYVGDLIAKRPFLGYGIEGMNRNMQQDLHTSVNRVHNEFLQYAQFYGVPAVAFYFSGCLGVFIRGLKNKKRRTDCNIAALTAAFAYLANSFFGVSMYYTTPMFFLLLGIAMNINSPVAENTETAR